jgi:hypothetical protein
MNLDSNSPEFQRAWAKIVAQAWADENFKSRLMSNPAQVLRDHGIKVPEDARLTMHPCLHFFHKNSPPPGTPRQQEQAARLPLLLP